MKCALCSTEKSNKIYIKSGYEIVECTNCSLVRTDNFDFDYKYDEYHRDLKEYLEYEKEFENIFRKRFELLNKRFEKPGKVLDIGSSTGTMLNLFKNAGWDVVGVEPSKNAAKIANKRGIKTYNSYFEKVRLKQGMFDLVIINHTFEHVADPILVLKKVGKLLKKGGLAYIDVPNFDSMDRRLKGNSWGYLMPNEHVHHFTPESLNLTAKKANLKVIWWDSWSGVFDVSSPVQKFVFQLKNRPKSFLFDLVRLPFNIITTLLKKGTSVAIIATR